MNINNALPQVLGSSNQLRLSRVGEDILVQSGNWLRCRGLVNSATPRSLGSRNRVSAAVKTTYEDSSGRQSAEVMYTTEDAQVVVLKEVCQTCCTKQPLLSTEVVHTAEPSENARLHEDMYSSCNPRKFSETLVCQIAVSKRNCDLQEGAS